MKTFDTKDWKLWNDITFKFVGYRKNFDLINTNENIITEYDGTISKVMLREQKPPVLLGEYLFSVWNIELGNRFNINFNQLLKAHHIENTYSELLYLIKKKHIDITNCKKLILINTFILHPDYRKCGVTEEFIEFMFRDFYDEKNIILALVQPIQYNPVDFDFYSNHKVIQMPISKRKSDGVINVSAKEYYDLNALSVKDDREKNEYKLYSLATKVGFSRLNESNIFVFKPEIIIKRMEEKRKIQTLINA